MNPDQPVSSVVLQGSNGLDYRVYIQPQYGNEVLQRFRELGAIHPQPVFLDLAAYGCTGHLVCNRIENTYYHHTTDSTGAPRTVPLSLGHFLVPQFFHPRPLIEFVVGLPAGSATVGPVMATVGPVMATVGTGSATAGTEKREPSTAPMKSA